MQGELDVIRKVRKEDVGLKEQRRPKSSLIYIAGHALIH